MVFSRRSEFSQTFAKALADWTSVGSKFAGLYGVEDVLEQIVAKIAADIRVLLIVLDGMSWAVCHELLDDIRREHWFEATLEKSSLPPLPVIATVPSVTQFSRATLLSGKVTNGDQGVERRNFEEHPALKAICDRKNPPVVFHKKKQPKGCGVSSGMGEGQMFSYRLCQSIRRILASEEHSAFWCNRATASLEDLRTEHSWASLEATSIVRQARRRQPNQTVARTVVKGENKTRMVTASSAA